MKTTNCSTKYSFPFFLAPVERSNTNKNWALNGTSCLYIVLLQFYYSIVGYISCQLK